MLHTIDGTFPGSIRPFKEIGMCACNNDFRQKLIWLLLTGSLLTSRLVMADTVSTSFENLGAGDFSIGISPITATFSGGNAQTVGNPAFYRNGIFSWHVGPNTTATI